MKNKTYIAISVAILAIGGYLIFNKLIKQPNRTKPENISIIVSNNFHENKSGILSSFEDSFLNNWATAVLSGKKTFFYKNKEYNTQGGTSIKK